MVDAFSPGLLTRIGEVRKVVLVRASRIGDFVCATPAFRALRDALPGVDITLIGLPFVEPLAARSAFIDRFEPFPGFPGIAEQFFDARAVVRSFGRLQRRKFDLAIQMHGTGVYSNTYLLLLGARVNAGFVREGDGPGRLDAALPMPSKGHEKERLLAFTTFLGAKKTSEACCFPLLPEDRAAADSLLEGAAPPLLGIHPYAREAEKRCPAGQFAAAAAALRTRHGGTVVVLGDGDPNEATADIGRMIGSPVVDLTSRTSVAVLGAVIRRLSVLVTNDSGPAHIAYALGAPAVAIFGETDPERWGPPREGPFRVVRAILPRSSSKEEDALSNHACLSGVSVEQVVKAASEVMRR